MRPGCISSWFRAPGSLWHEHLSSPPSPPPPRDPRESWHLQLGVHGLRLTAVTRAGTPRHDPRPYRDPSSSPPPLHPGRTPRRPGCGASSTGGTRWATPWRACAAWPTTPTASSTASASPSAWCAPPLLNFCLPRQLRFPAFLPSLFSPPFLLSLFLKPSHSLSLSRILSLAPAAGSPVDTKTHTKGRASRSRPCCVSVPCCVRAYRLTNTRHANTCM